MNRGITLLIIGLLAVNTVWLADLSQHRRGGAEISQAQMDQIRTIVREEALLSACVLANYQHYKEQALGMPISFISAKTDCYQGDTIRTD